METPFIGEFEWDMKWDMNVIGPKDTCQQHGYLGMSENDGLKQKIGVFSPSTSRENTILRVSYFWTTPSSFIRKCPKNRNQ